MFVPVDGDCQAQQDAVELTWLSPAEAREDSMAAEMTAGTVCCCDSA
jgi:hypothetical protein